MSTNGQIHFGFDQTTTPIQLLQFTPDSAHFVTGDDHEVFTWNINGNAALHRPAHPEPFTSGAAFPVGVATTANTFIVSDGAGHATVCDLRTRHAITTGISVPSGISDLTSDPAGRALAIIATRARGVRILRR